MFGIFLYDLLFWLIPLLFILFFLFCLLRFLAAKKNPDAFSSNEIKSRGLLLAVSAIPMAILLFCVIGVIAILSGAIAFM